MYLCDSILYLYVVKYKRLFLLLFVSACLFISVSAQKVTLNYQNVKLEKVFSTITKQTNLTFAYSLSVIDINKEVTIRVKQADLAEVLTTLFAGMDIDFEINKGKIYLMNKADFDKERSVVETISISGFITDEEGEELIAATVIEKGTANGTVTNWNGVYTLSVAPDAILMVSYVGYYPQEIPVNNQKTINIKLVENPQALSEVVITALGIEKKEESLSYAIQKIGGVELTRAKNPNPINSLAGKVSNVTINRNSSGLGASSRVIIRGVGSASKNNQPLYVLDGMPILNPSIEQAYSTIGGIANAGNRDGGDGLSTLNPEDIESITVLKGASASALYGSQAANGVILITTKKGMKGVREVRFSSGVTFDTPISLPRFQNSYSYVPNSTEGCWGDKTTLPVYDNLSDFFRTGVSCVTTATFTTGSEKNQAYFSYANTSAIGVIPDNKLSRHNLNLRETVGFFSNRLVLDANINFVIQTNDNKPVSGGFYMNPLVGLYTFPRGVDMSSYKNNYEVWSDERKMYVQNWYATVDDGFEQNPYWLTNRVQKTDRQERLFGSVKASVKINDWLNLQARGNADYIKDYYEEKMYASTSVGLAGKNGRFIDFFYQDRLLYGDIMLLFNRSVNILDFNVVAGVSIEDLLTKIIRYDSGTASLYYPNVFTIANVVNNTDMYINEIVEREQMQSLFASFQLGINESYYIDLTARNGWSSTLAFTNSKNKGFFYPSIGTTWILSKTLDMPEWISYSKIRSSWGQVGNGLTPHASKLLSHIVAGGKIQESHTASYQDLKPETSTSLEAGTEWKFFAHRLSADFTIYRTNTKDQLFTLPTPAGESEYKSYNVNSGNIQNQGIEFTLTGMPVSRKDFYWKSALNYSHNRNLVLELHKDMVEYTYGVEGISTNYSMLLRKGGSFGDIYGKVFDRDENGNILYDNKGLPIVTETSNINKVGNVNPDFLLGWSNTLAYKDLTLYFLIDARFGGSFLSQTQAELDIRGVSEATGEARDRGYVDLEGHRITNVKDFYKMVGGRDGVTEYYMYDATNIRLREVALEYKFPEKLMQKIKYITSIQLSCTAQNLLFLYKKTPFDPDATLSSDNDNQGIDVFGTPLTRSVGINARVVF